MKKLLILLTTALTVTISSCKKDDKNTHIGTWEVTKITTSTDGEASVNDNYYANENTYLVDFNADGTIRSGYVSFVNSRVCVDDLNYTLESDQFNFTNNIFLKRIYNGKVEFKDKNKIIITGTRDGSSITIELIRTEQKIDNYIITQCVG